MTAEAIIAACTRNGVTSWQNVARQLGRSVDSVRCAYDPQYLHIRPWPHVCEVVPHPDESMEDPLEPNDADIPTNSPYDKGPGMKAQILCLLTRHGPMSVEALSGLLNRTKLSVRKRLNDMRAELLVCNDSGGQHNSGTFGWTWSITKTGQGAVTGHASANRGRS